MSNRSQSGGIGFFGGLQLLFIGLKLGNVIDWSWFWVFSPIWISFLVLLLLATLIVIVKNFSKQSSTNKKIKWK